MWALRLKSADGGNVRFSCRTLVMFPDGATSAIGGLLGGLRLRTRTARGPGVESSSPQGIDRAKLLGARRLDPRHPRASSYGEAILLSCSVRLNASTLNA